MSDQMLGVYYLFRGYVTTVRSVKCKSPRELERVLGLSPGSLSAGFCVFALAAPIGIGDFEWKDRTAYSDGWHFDHAIGEFVQRRDELRAHLGRRNGTDEVKTDAELLDLMLVQAQRLNVRVGPNRIVKVIPTGRTTFYPDSPCRDVPQWTLRVKKPFVRVASVARGAWFD